MNSICKKLFIAIICVTAFGNVILSEPAKVPTVLPDKTSVVNPNHGRDGNNWTIPVKIINGNITSLKLSQTIVINQSRINYTNGGERNIGNWDMSRFMGKGNSTPLQLFQTIIMNWGHIGIINNPGKTSTFHEDKPPVLPDLGSGTKRNFIKFETAPWQVGLVNKSWHLFCNGVIIAPFWVVTAAHCVHKYCPKTSRMTDFFITFGDDNYNKGNTREVEYIVCFGGFKLNKLNFNNETIFVGLHDIALIQIKKEFDFDKIEKRVKMKRKRNITYTNSMVNISGWDAIKGYGSDLLQGDRMKIILDAECKDMLSKWRVRKNRLPYQLCLQYANLDNQCHNSAESAVVDGLLIGISAMVNATGKYVCDIGGLQFYTNIPSYYNWICNSMNGSPLPWPNQLEHCPQNLPSF